MVIDEIFALSAAEMQATDRAAIEQWGIPGTLLMERAGMGAWEAMTRLLDSVDPMVLFAGKGNNGGDALVVARYAVMAGVKAHVVLLHDPSEFSTDAKFMYQLARESRVPFLYWGEGEDRTPAAVAKALQRAAVVVDGLLGTGLAGSPRGSYAQVIKTINACREVTGKRPRIVALDVPSGLDSDTGWAYDPAVRADLTITFHAPKTGLLMGPALEFTGDVWLAPIGIPPEAMPPVKTRLLLPHQVLRDLPVAGPDSHKGSRGRLWIVAGSRGMAGAAILAARSALRAGAGLVHVAVPAGERPVVAQAVPEALTLPLPDGEDGAVTGDAIPVLADALQSADAIVVGPGLGQAPAARQVVEWIIGWAEVPLIMDADALNVLRHDWREIVPAGRGPKLITPHPGEAARWLGVDTAAVQADRPAAARDLARESGAVVVLKGARTLIASPDGALWINPTGTPALSTGGTGDVLAGAAGAYCAQGVDVSAAARTATFIHGWAGQMLADEYGISGVIAGDLPAAMAKATHRLRQGSRDDWRRLVQSCGLFNIA